MAKIIKVIIRVGYYANLVREIVSILDECTREIAEKCGAEDWAIGNKLGRVKQLLDKIDL